MQSFFRRYLTREEYLIFKLTLITFGAGCLYILINRWVTHYTGFNYLPRRWVILFPFVLALFIYASNVEDKAPRLARVTKSYSMSFFIATSFAILTNGMQFTPFPQIDEYLLRVDQSIHFDARTFLEWSANHPDIQSLLAKAYVFLNIEFVLISLIVPCFYNKKRISHFFMTMLVAFLIGTTIYYFFPTAGPTSVIDSPYFIPDAHDTYLKFYQIHHYQPVTTGGGGMIAFPSFHVTWSILLCYALRGRKYFLYPMVVINTIVILSTLLLGWHYLIDVFAGVALSIITVVIVNRLFFNGSIADDAPHAVDTPSHR